MNPTTLSSIAFAISVAAFASIYFKGNLLRESHRREWLTNQAMKALTDVLTDPKREHRDARLAALDVIQTASGYLLMEIDAQSNRPWWRRPPPPGK